jgi:4-carboxymuconolactone decarboxylase
MIDRMPPLEPAAMDEAQARAAAALIAGPRKAVVGPFIALLRSPELLDRMQRVGEYLRFGSPMPRKLAELAMLVTARHVSNAFEWAVHYPLALKEGVSRETLDAINARLRPDAMAADEEIVHDFCRELLATHSVCDATYARAMDLLGEKGLVDLVGTVGYFISVCLVMNAAGTPAPESDAPALLA